MRLDSDGSSFGLDISLRLGNRNFAGYQALYLFEDIEHSSVVFRALARKITVTTNENV